MVNNTLTINEDIDDLFHNGFDLEQLTFDNLATRHILKDNYKKNNKLIN